MFAIRAAKAHTGKPKVAKIEGGMNGSSDYGQFSVRGPGSFLAGPSHRPTPIPSMAGLSEALKGEMVILPFNDLEHSAAIIRHHKDDLACVIVEPVLGVGGMIPATPEYLEGLRQVTAECGVLLIFDEVITFRVSVGGAQEYYGVSPDLTALGKVIGGGLPVGGVGGRRDIMAVFDPTAGDPPITLSGTFCANPLTAVAGIATLKKLNAAAIAHLNRLGDRVRRELTRVFADVGVPACVVGLGSLFQVHFTATTPMCYRDTLRDDQRLLRMLFFWLHNNGVFILPRGLACVSLPMNDQDIDRLVALVADFAGQLRRESSARADDQPAIEPAAPARR
jgi:glutamate-1-semialdehyde 2,1-aminomutase